MAVFTGMTHVLDRLEPSTLTDLVSLDILTDLDDDSSSFVACTFDSQLGHLREGPIVEHEVDIAKAEAGGIELDQHIVGACERKMVLDQLLGKHGAANTYRSQAQGPSLPRRRSRDLHSSVEFCEKDEVCPSCEINVPQHQLYIPWECRTRELVHPWRTSSINQAAELDCQ